VHKLVAMFTTLLLGSAIAGDRPQSGSEVYAQMLAEIGRELKQAGVLAHAQDGGLAFQVQGIDVVVFGNVVMHAQKGNEVSWVVPEPQGKGGMQLRELKNPPPVVGDEIMKAVRHFQLVSGDPMPANGWYLVSIYEVGGAARLDRALLINFTNNTASVMDATSTEKFLGTVNSQLTTQVLQQHHQQQQWMISQNARNNERVLDAMGAMSGRASYNPWAP
jgi:hypothetical protein